MPKLMLDLFIVVSLFAPLLLTVCVAGDTFSAQALLTELGWEWQAGLLATLVLPVLALRRLKLLQAPSRPPSVME